MPDAPAAPRIASPRRVPGAGASTTASIPSFGTPAIENQKQRSTDADRDRRLIQDVVAFSRERFGEHCCCSDAREHADRWDCRFYPPANIDDAFRTALEARFGKRVRLEMHTEESETTMVAKAIVLKTPPRFLTASERHMLVLAAVATLFVLLLKFRESFYELKTIFVETHDAF